MELYLDSANLAEVREAAGWGILSGVTTNPTLVAKEGADFHQRVRDIAAIVDGPVSAEVVSTDTDGMLAEADELHKLHPNVVIKVPLTPAGLAAVRRLADDGVATNVTLCFSAAQGLLAARAGATYVSPFVGRLDDIGHDGIGLVRELSGIFATHDLPTRIIAASIRHPQHVVEAAKAGADIATVPFAVLRQLFEHPLTTSGLERFLADWARVQKPGG